jgi:hypothetical protein
MGLSYDWEREIATYKLTITYGTIVSFSFTKGLAYKKPLVNCARPVRLFGE